MKEDNITILSKLVAFGWAGLISISLYLSPIYPLMALVGLMILGDTITGRWAARHEAQSKGQDIRIAVSSKKTRQGLFSKIISYNVIIISVYILDRYMLTDLFTHFFPTFPVEYSATKLGGLILMWVEFDSIDENYYKVKKVRIRDIISDKIKIIKSSFNKVKKDNEKN